MGVYHHITGLFYRPFGHPARMAHDWAGGHSGCLDCWVTLTKVTTRRLELISSEIGYVCYNYDEISYRRKSCIIKKL